jgi:hypothetical protein
MPAKSKPVRIFAADDSALEALAMLRRRSRAEVIHEALAEYVARHREELSSLSAETQQAIASGDIDRLARVSAARRDGDAGTIMAGTPSYDPVAYASLFDQIAREREALAEARGPFPDSTADIRADRERDE